MCARAGQCAAVGALPSDANPTTGLCSAPSGPSATASQSRIPPPPFFYPVNLPYILFLFWPILTLEVRGKIPREGKKNSHRKTSASPYSFEMASFNTFLHVSKEK